MQKWLWFTHHDTKDRRRCLQAWVNLIKIHYIFHLTKCFFSVIPVSRLLKDEQLTIVLTFESANLKHSKNINHQPIRSTAPTMTTTTARSSTSSKDVVLDDEVAIGNSYINSTLSEVLQYLRRFFPFLIYVFCNIWKSSKCLIPK